MVSTGTKVVFGAASVVMACHPSWAAAPLEFDGVRAGVGPAAIVSTRPEDSDDPIQVDAYASLEVGAATGLIGFWGGFTVVFPRMAWFCTGQGTPEECPVKTVDVQTGIDYVAHDARVGPWIGIGESLYPSAGFRVEWLPVHVNDAGALGVGVKGSMLAFPPFVQRIPALEIDFAIRFDLLGR